VHGYGALQSCSHKCTHMHISLNLIISCELPENNAESHTKDAEWEK